jgi:hypothetical protein
VRRCGVRTEWSGEVDAYPTECSVLSLFVFVFPRPAGQLGALLPVGDLLLIKLYLPSLHAESGCDVRHASINSSDAKCYDHDV